MHFLFICKASSSTGLGHLIRSRSLADQFLKLDEDITIDFKLIGDDKLERLLTNQRFESEIVEKEDDLSISHQYDIAFLDLIPMSEAFFLQIKKHSKLTVSISPIFDHLEEVDLIFNRTTHHRLRDRFTEEQYFGGLEYTIIQSDCKRIPTAVYEENLKSEQFPIAVMMGGGDAPNKTLRFLKSLKACPVPATFWVLLGEGYKHSYDELIEVIKKDSEHEIILAKTNRSTWKILSNCVLAIFPGGISSYEAAYAGLPTIIMLDNEENYFLIQELVDNNICSYNGVLNNDSLNELNNKIESFYSDKKLLSQMHLNAKGLVKGSAADRILNICMQRLKKKIVVNK